MKITVKGGAGGLKALHCRHETVMSVGRSKTKHKFLPWVSVGLFGGVFTLCCLFYPVTVHNKHVVHIYSQWFHGIHTQLQLQNYVSTLYINIMVLRVECD